MSQRSYKQACPLAFSLDLIGERWTLLIVRDLLLGPLRFSDFLSRLPGIGRNLLAKRLQHLREQGIVEKKHLDPPAGSVVYELTDKGADLEEGMMAFVAWGMHYGSSKERLEGHNEPDLIGLVLKIMFDPAMAREGESIHELVIDGNSIHATITKGQIIMRRGQATHPSIRLIGSQAFFEKILHERTIALEASIKADTLTIEGDLSTARHVFELYGVTIT